ncbi:MAG: thiamine phosphate synthase [Bacteroidales bacterium]|nr:thiamine phosphate synthase [Bacteroidales bacterium]
MIIVITRPDFWEGEADAIVQLFDQRHIDRLHLRKPDASATEVARLVKELPSRLYPKISVHDHFDIADEYHLGGIHLTGRHPVAPAHWCRLLSTSCHSMDELRQRRNEPFDYLSLSPIFDSISKAGYQAAFTREEIAQAHDEGLIDQRVLALGGVTFARLAEVEAMGFGGGMILGDAWK